MTLVEVEFGFRKLVEFYINSLGPSDKEISSSPAPQVFDAMIIS